MDISIILVSRKQTTMGNYHIFLDDDLVASVERLIKLDGSFQQWLQDQVDSWLRSGVAGASSGRKTHSRVSDEELSEKLKDFTPLKDSDFPDLNGEAYSEFIKNQSGHLPKGVERWL